MAEGVCADLLINSYRAELALSEHRKHVLILNLRTYQKLFCNICLTSGWNEVKNLTVVSF